MKKEIDNIFVDVRNAFRLLSRYQKRILNIISVPLKWDELNN